MTDQRATIIDAFELAIYRAWIVDADAIYPPNAEMPDPKVQAQVAARAVLTHLRALPVERRMEAVGMTQVGWYQPTRRVGENLWPARMIPNSEWAQPVIPVFGDTAEGELVTRAGEIALQHVEMWVCDLCLGGVGGECHVPGCVFWMRDAPHRQMCELLNEKRTDDD